MAIFLIIVGLIWALITYQNRTYTVGFVQSMTLSVLTTLIGLGLLFYGGLVLYAVAVLCFATTGVAGLRAWSQIREGKISEAFLSTMVAIFTAFIGWLLVIN